MNSQNRITWTIGTGEYCEKHPDEELVKTNPEFFKSFKEPPPNTPVCPACTRENIAQEDRKIAKTAQLSAHITRTHKVLKEQSIITDNTLKVATFDSFKRDTGEQIRNFEQMKEVVNAIVKGEPLNVWLVGKAGRGKSHLAMSALDKINEFGRTKIDKAFHEDGNFEGEGFSCLFVSVDKMLQLIRGSFSDKESKYTEDRCIDMCTRAGVLVLDDLGAESGAIEEDERANKFVHRVLYAIANGRMDKATIITTNLKAEQRAALYDEKLISRLYSNKAELLFIESPDMRASQFEW
ncbi:DNA replication protein [Exiguobacterium phage vB_EauM-23]|nr:DNA replication protein [Exiguobacterium phage vB_EauM-23]